MNRYAAQTQVSSDRTRAEIERVLMRYGASAFMYGWQERSAIIGFEMANRRVKFVLPMPLEDEYAYTAKGRLRAPAAAMQAKEQAFRQRWRALALVIKAKLEAVESGITEFETEFLAHIVLPDGKTVGQHMLPQIAASYETGRVPPMLPHLDS